MSALVITTENFETEVMQSKKPVLLDFWASWCSPCTMLSPIIDEIASEVSNVKICKVNIDDQKQLATKFRVMSIPTLVLIKDGKALQTMVGVKPKAEILKMLAL